MQQSPWLGLIIWFQRSELHFSCASTLASHFPHDLFFFVCLTHSVFPLFAFHTSFLFLASFPSPFPSNNPLGSPPFLIFRGRRQATGDSAQLITPKSTAHPQLGCKATTKRRKKEEENGRREKACRDKSPLITYCISLLRPNSEIHSVSS